MSTVASLLREKGIPFYEEDDSLRITLPSGFGQMEIGRLNDNDTILGLVGYEWHTHGDLLVPTYGNDEPTAVVAFVEAILEGTLKMVEYQLPGEEPERFIEDDLEAFRKYQQSGETSRVFEP